MHSPVLKKSLHIISEGQNDARIIRTLITCDSFENVYQVNANGYQNMASLCRTLRLMMEEDDKMLIIFDADSEDDNEIRDKVATFEFISRADINRDKMRVFCFKPYLEKALFPKELQYKQIDNQKVDYIKENLQELRQKELIKNIQKFIDE